MCPVRPQGIRNPRSLVGAGLRPRPVGGDGGFVGADPCVGPRADPAKSVSGRTHRSAPTRWGRRSEPTENWCEDGALSAGRDGARPLQRERSRAVRPAAGCAWGVASASQIPFRNLGRQSRSPRPTGATLVVRSSGPMWASAPTDRRGSRIDHPGQRRTAERLRRGREGWVEIGAWIIPKGASNAGQSLSRPPGDSSLYTREPWGRGMRIAASALRASSQ